MTKTIRQLIESTDAIICPTCNGEGEYGSFCGHETTETCCMCCGRGVVKSLKRVKLRKDCIICNGKGCLGGCNNKGYHEWDIFEPLVKSDLEKMTKKR